MGGKLHPVSRNGETVGPWSVEQIVERLASGGLAITDFVWNSTEWVPLVEFADLKSHLHAKRPTAPPSTQMPVHTAPSSSVTEPITEPIMIASLTPPETEKVSLSQADALEWYVTRGQQRFGPFTYFGVIKALQEKSIFEFDYVWKEGSEGWVRIAEHELFTQARIRELRAEPVPALASVFAKRRHERFRFETEILINDNLTLSPGQLIEIGAGGAGMIVKNTKLMPGQLVNLHIASTDGFPAFNAVAEIVSKRFERVIRNTTAPIQYGARYVKVDRAVEQRVKDYFQSLGHARQLA